MLFSLGWQFYRLTLYRSPKDGLIWGGDLILSRNASQCILPPQLTSEYVCPITIVTFSALSINVNVTTIMGHIDNVLLLLSYNSCYI